jgi:hypothetical protein
MKFEFSVDYSENLGDLYTVKVEYDSHPVGELDIRPLPNSAVLVEARLDDPVRMTPEFLARVEDAACAAVYQLTRERKRTGS